VTCEEEEDGIINVQELKTKQKKFEKIRLSVGEAVEGCLKPTQNAQDQIERESPPEKQHSSIKGRGGLFSFLSPGN